MMSYITLTKENIDTEHICCAFSDKKCTASYQAKKEWMKTEFDNGYVFKRLDERAKVFIEYGPAEKAWLPIDAPDYVALGCLWVSGKYKKSGHAKQLLAETISEAKAEGKIGLVTIAGRKKKHFMSDTKWLLKQGFEICDKAANDFVLLYLPFDSNTAKPIFLEKAKQGTIEEQGCVAYYSNKCPYSEYHVTESLRESCDKRRIPYTIIKLKSLNEARDSPSPATIFSLFYNGTLVTTDLSACMDSRFDKFIKLD